jgi:para-nitrobenzyl esterase
MTTNTIRALLVLTIAAIVMGWITTSLGGTADAQRSSGRAGLGGTSWQLVKFQNSDGSTLVPDDRSRYTITFRTDGRVTARVDCNRGSSTWKSTGPNQLRFGSWSMTRARCASGSLHDTIVREGADVRSYVLKDGHLFLSGMEGGGIYELEPLKTG